MQNFPIRSLNAYFKTTWQPTSVLLPRKSHGWRSLVSMGSKESDMTERLHFTTMLETGVRSLGGEDPLEKEMAPYSCTLAWKIPWMEDPGRLQSMGSQRAGRDCATSLSLYLIFILLYLEKDLFFTTSLTTHLPSVHGI